MNNESKCISGSIKLTQVVCEEKPFSFSYDGRILFYDEVCLTWLRTVPFFGQKEVPFPRPVGEAITNALNDAYKLGYEKDRTVWK